ncbi:MAG TPA: hypothetical protein VLJ17_15135 [Xanthobacteraceae bacterium]|nr:hypothetical protein [Xanthobacteraceae bacterium]
MSVSRSPHLAEIRRREDQADARKVRNIIAILCALAAFSFVGAVIIMGKW